MRAYLTKAQGWFCEDGCEDTITTAPGELKVWRADPDHKLSLSDYNWTYYNLEPREETVWECPDCGQLYVDEPEQVYLWQCGHCKDYYTEEENAKECCQ